MGLVLALIAFPITHSTCLFILPDPVLLEGLTWFVRNKHHLGWPASQVLSRDLESIPWLPVNTFIITGITGSSLVSTWGRNQDLYLLNLHNPHSHPETESPMMSPFTLEENQPQLGEVKKSRSTWAFRNCPVTHWARMADCLLAWNGSLILKMLWMCSYAKP